MLEQNKIYLGDCLELMKDIDDQSISAIIVDLPYGTTVAKWDSVIPFQPLWEQYKRILKENGVVILFGSQPFTSALVMSNPKWFKEELIWEKDRASNFANAKVRHLKYHENILVFAKGKYTYNRQMQTRTSERMGEMQKNKNINFRSSISSREDNEIVFNTDYEGRSYDVYDAKLKNPSTVIYNPIVNSNSKEKLPHPTQKPIKLLEYLVRTFSNDGDLILDNTCGVGSLPVAVLNVGNRSFIGIEKDERYYDIAVNRINGYIYAG